jgi:predicted RNase H-like HicB family nuclease
VTESVTLTAVFETVDEGWVQARLEELPGVITAATTATEAKALLLDALKEYLLSLDPGDAALVSEDARRERVELSLTSS